MSEKRKHGAHLDDAGNRSSQSDAHRLTVSNLTRKSFVSQSALVNILRDIRQNGLPEVQSRASMHRYREELAHTETSYGPLMSSVSIGKLETEVINPFAFLSYICEESTRYGELMLKTLTEHGEEPLTIVLYQDGVDPGDGLVKDKARHSICFYWTFLEFGMINLCHEELWVAGLIARTRKAKSIHGGVGELTYILMEQFHPDNGNDMLVNGVVVKLGGREMRIRAKVNVLFADLPALSEMISAKGHSGNKFCPCCQNASNTLVRHGSTPLHQKNKYYVPLTETDFSKFKLHSNASLRDVLKKLETLKGTTMTKGEFEDLETNVYGFKWSPRNILANARFGIDPADSIHFDWGHTYLENGVGDAEFGIFMKTMHQATTKHKFNHSCTYKVLGEYVAKWKLPKARGELMHLFDEDHARRFINSGNFSCSSSEFLALTPILYRFLTRIVMPQVRNTRWETHVKSMVAVLKVIKMLTMTKVKGRIDPQDLMRAILEHLQLFKAVYGEKAMKPKHHFALHLPRQLRRLGVLLSTFTNERKHRVFKRYARGRTILRSFEKGVSQEVLCHNIYELCEKRSHVVSTSKPSKRQLTWLRSMFPDCSNFTLHNEIYRFGYVTHGDIIACTHENTLRIGELMLTVGMDRSDGTPTLQSIVSLFDSGESDDWFISCHVRDVASKIESRNVLASLTYAMAADRSSCIVVDPR